MSVDVRLAADGVWAILDAISGVNAYRGEIKDDQGNPTTPPEDTDGRSHPHLIFYPNAGRAETRRLGMAFINVGWGFQVTCVGGDDNRAMWTVTQVRAALSRQRITLDGAPSGLIYEDADSGAVRRDDDVTPPRYYVPLVFGLRI